jgi:putative DNA primase/helicase
MISASETPKTAARLLAAGAIAKGFKPEALHEYRGADGKPIYWRIRAKRDDGEKWIRPMTVNGHGYELREPGFGNKKPLYNLDRIAVDPSSTIWIVEGEKPADALTQLGALTTTSGSATSANDADWSPVAGRTCIIWPDNDDAGKSYAGDVATILIGLGCKVSAVDIARIELPAKGDAADWVQSHQNASLSDMLALPMLACRPRAMKGTEAGTDGPTYISRRLSDVEAKPIRWLWAGRIARGKVSMIAGHPGLGKSQLTAALAGVVTTGGHWPVDRSVCEAGAVVLLNAEDDAADTIRPRLEAAGADISRCEILDAVVDGYAADGSAITRGFNLRDDLRALDRMLADRGDVAMVVIDPITAYLSGVETHVNADVRAVLSPLGELAARHDVAIVCVSHLNKAGGSKGGSPGDAMLRVSGSLAFVAASRAAYLVVRDPGDPNRRLFLPAKNNIAKDNAGLAFAVESHLLPSGIETARVMWEPNAVAISADEAMAPQDDDDRTMTDDAVDFLRDALTAGRVLARDIKRRASESGITDKALRNARGRLGVVVTREGFGAEIKSYWTLGPAPVLPSEPINAQQITRAQMDYEGTNGAIVEEF